MGQHLKRTGWKLSSLLDEMFGFTKGDVFGRQVIPVFTYDTF